jgi:molybdopterin synthase sulfur carrier subunit
MTNTITVKYWGALAKLTRLEEEEVDAANVKDVLSYLKVKYGTQAAKVAGAMLIALNGRNILHMKLFKTPLNAGDEVSFFPMSAGG